MEKRNKYIKDNFFPSVFLISLVLSVLLMHLFQKPQLVLCFALNGTTFICVVISHLYALSFQIKDLINLENPVCL